MYSKWIIKYQYCSAPRRLLDMTYMTFSAFLSQTTQFVKCVVDKIWVRAL